MPLGLLPRLATDTVEKLLVVSLDTVNVAVATTPSVSKFRLYPKSTQLYRPAAGLPHTRFFEAAVAAGPTDTLIALNSAVEYVRSHSNADV